MMILKHKLMAVGGIASLLAILQGCVAVPVAAPNTTMMPAPVVYNPIAAPVMYTPAPVIDAILLGMTGVALENFIFRNGWTYIRYPNRYGHWIENRYRPGDYRTQLLQRHHQLMGTRQATHGFRAMHQARIYR